MDLLERILFFTAGGAIGFVLGYIVAGLRKIEEELDEVVHTVKKTPRNRNERGFMRNPLIADVAYLLSLLLILLGLWQMKLQSDRADVDRDNIGELSVCNTEYLRAQAQFLNIYLEVPPPTDPQKYAALQEYLELLEAYDTDEASILEDSPYTNNEALRECVESDIEKEIRQDE